MTHKSKPHDDNAGLSKCLWVENADLKFNAGNGQKDDNKKPTEQRENRPPRGGGGGTLGISGWECAAGTLEPLTYTRASSAEFCYPILE